MKRIRKSQFQTTVGEKVNICIGHEMKRYRRSGKLQQPQHSILKIIKTPKRISWRTVSFPVNVATLTINSTLVSFLRDTLHLKGTKISCYQGGCGVCIVTASVPTKEGRKVISINSVSQTRRKRWAVVVPQLVERSLPTSEVRGSNPVIAETLFIDSLSTVL